MRMTGTTSTHQEVASLGAGRYWTQAHAPHLDTEVATILLSKLALQVTVTCTKDMHTSAVRVRTHTTGDD
jgi:hypothetical protein